MYLSAKLLIAQLTGIRDREQKACQGVCEQHTQMSPRYVRECKDSGNSNF